MSGIAPRRSKVVFDPLMNPGDAPTLDAQPTDFEYESHPLASSSVARSKLPVDELKRMALAAPAVKVAAAAAPEPDDVPVQRLSDFLGSGSAVASSELFGETDRAAAKKKKAALFADDDDDEEDEDEATTLRKQKRAAAAAAAAEEKAKAVAAAQAAQDALVESIAASSAAASDAAPASSSAALSAASKRAGGKDLFDDDSSRDEAAQKALGLQGVFVPEGAAEYHAQPLQAEEIDPTLLQEADDAELDRLGAGQSNAAEVPTAADDLDDDLFSFAAPATKPAGSTVDASDPNFDFNSYLQQQTASAGSGAVSKGASLFDDDDD